MGNIDDMMAYYTLYNKELSRLLEGAKHAVPARLPWEFSGIDTAVHYDIMLLKLPAMKIQSTTIAPGQGCSSHRQKTPLHRDAYGRLLNDNGEVFSVIHQLDRKSTLHLWNDYVRYGDLLYQPRGIDNRRNQSVLTKNRIKPKSKPKPKKRRLGKGSKEFENSSF